MQVSRNNPVPRVALASAGFAKGEIASAHTAHQTKQTNFRERKFRHCVPPFCKEKESRVLNMKNEKELREFA
jgi:hypothetical protein